MSEPQKPPQEPVAPAPEPQPVVKEMKPAQPIVEQKADAAVPESPVMQSAKEEQAAPQEPLKTTLVPKKVFFVAGSDEAVNQEVLHFLVRCGVIVIRTYDPETKKRLLDDGYAISDDIRHVVGVLSGDHHFYSMHARPADAKIMNDQDATFELAYLMGKMGRFNSFVLHVDQKRFILPGRFLTFMSVPINKDQTWRQRLLEKLRMWGFVINP